ncbi:MAG: DUF2169 domain-containing protein [Desulfocurvibacter africanus]
MKVFKPKEHALMVRPLGIRGKTYMAATVMLYFDLTAPDGLLGEQELWTTVPGLLGQGTALDQGVPKPRGEFLVTGACCAPRGETRPVSQVSVRVGPLSKSVSVFGDRAWKQVGNAAMSIGEPTPFSAMPVTWEHAFGGPGFLDNPLGKGVQPLATPGGGSVLPLPNLEYPDRLIGSPDDRLPPACFGPLDMTWPQRASKAGTYGDKWLKERWPWFPDDMNYEFFNLASADQMLPGFLTGEEAVEIRNMHPDLPLIASRLPRVRPRLFATLKKSPKAGPEEDTFREIGLHVDTLWLFPEALRGVVMHRGLTEILDEELEDVRYVLSATESPDEPAKPIEHYLQEQRKHVDRMVPLNSDPGADARRKVDRAMLQFKALPRKIEEAKQQALGKTPVMPRTPEDMAALSDRLTAEGAAVLDELEPVARDLHARFGHLAKIDLEVFDAWRAKLKAMSSEVGKAVDQAKAAQAKGAKGMDELKKSLKAKVRPDLLAKAGIDPDDPLPIRKVNPWHDAGFPVAIECRRRLEVDAKAMDALRAMGLSRRSIGRAWLGLNDAERRWDGTQWGLKDGEVILPAGLVLPKFREATLIGLVVLAGWSLEFSAGDLPLSPPVERVAAKGSDDATLFLPADEGAPVVAAAGELEAWLLAQEVGDVCGVLVLPSPDADPGKAGDEALKVARALVAILPEGPPLTETDSAPWQALHPAACVTRLPKGASVLQAKANGISLRDLILDALPPEAVGLPPIPTADEADGREAPGFQPPAPGEIKDQILKAIDEVKAALMPKFDAAKAKQAEAMEMARTQLAKRGLDLDEVMAKSAEAPRPGLAESGQRMAESLALSKQKVQAAGGLTPGIAAKYGEAATRIKAMSSDAEARLTKGLAEIEDGKKRIAEAMAKVKAGELPPEAKDKFAAFGIDPDRIVRRSREEVVAMHARGESLAGAILSEVDLSYLDLRGIDLSGAQFGKTLLCGTNLAGANLSKAMGQEADFSGACLSGADLTGAVLQKTSFAEAILCGARLKQAVLNGSDLSGADFSDAILDMVVIQKAKLDGADVRRASLKMCVIEGSATGADFRGARFTQCVLKRMLLDGADFSDAALNSTVLQACQGEGVRFTGANLDKIRLIAGTSLPGADLRDTHMLHGCLKDSCLAGANLSGSVLEWSIIEGCDLSGAGLYGVRAVRTRFIKTNLENADMRFANLMSGSLRKSRLVGTDLRGANLYGVDFYKAVMGRTQLEGANLKMSLLQDRTEFLP